MLGLTFFLVRCDLDEVELGETCVDGIQNQGETGVDCGGPCASCATDCNANIADIQPPGSACNDGNANTTNDLYNSNCICLGDSGTPSCSDGIMNQGEEGIDCGGPCTACETDCNTALIGVQAPGSICDDGNTNTNNDTYNQNCICTGTSIGTCNDGIQNQGETAIDCGGPCDPNQGVIIGDEWLGGMVAYILTSNDLGYDECITHGIIVHIDPLGTHEWGCMGTTINNAVATSIGSGAANTESIVTNCSGSSAANPCYDLVQSSFSDWYLPSKNELNKTYTGLQLTGIHNFGAIIFWSSSSTDSNFAWTQNFDSGFQSLQTKLNEFNVLAVRSF